MKVFFLSIVLLLNWTLFNNQSAEAKRVSLSAEVLEIEKAGPSGTIIQYHHVRLRVLNICAGEENRPEIIVVYVSVSTREVDDLKVGDVICLNAVKTDKFKEGVEDWREVLREYGKDDSDLSDENLPTHYGGDYIRNCQCYKD